MTIIIKPNHLEVAEVEFFPKHPDIFCSAISAKIVQRLSEKIEDLKSFRCDINVQALAQENKIIIRICGQILIPSNIDLQKECELSTFEVLQEGNYSKFIQTRKIEVDVKVIKQSHLLTKTSKDEKFADSCVVYGHYVQEPFGINGTFPSLIISQEVDRMLHKLQQEYDEIEPDGKVHSQIRYTNKGFEVEDINISISHKKTKKDYRKIIEQRLRRELNYKVRNITINLGGDFNNYFLDADFGVSKAKDDVLITGGVHQLGTDRVWGKCLYKASSSLIPYTFLLSKVICELTGAKFCSIAGYCKYGSKEAQFILQDIDSDYEKYRDVINEKLRKVPRSRSKIINIVQNDLREFYKQYNQPEKFHSSKNPWKKENKIIEELFIKNVLNK